MKVTTIAFVALAPVLASCASTGLYNMSDEWCAKHLNASEARCPGAQQQRVVHNDRDHPTDKQGANGE